MTSKLPKGITERSGKFRVSIMVAGKRRTATCTTLEEAEATTAQLKLGLYETTAIEKKTWNLQTAWENYVDYRVAASTHSTSNPKKFDWYGRMIFDFFGPLANLDEITVANQSEFFDVLTVDRKYSASTVNYLGTLLHQMQLHAHKRGRKRIPPVRMQGRKLTKGRVRFVSDIEEATMLDWYDRTGREEFGNLVKFFIDTGFRKSEAFRLRFNDLDFKTGRITVWETKTNTPRTVKMTARVRAILESLERQSNEHDAKVFRRVSEKKFYRVWWEMREAIGLDGDKQFVIHCLRHTCATRLCGAGVDIRTVMAWLGHKSIEQTQRYAHFIPSRMDDAADALDTLATGI
tara:strand:+ start:508 stop:1548 length:1041 start_codon:yes stop_codon:yes gene_type:complete